MLGHDQRWPVYIIVIVVTLETQPVCCVIQRWSVYTVEPVYSGHP